MFTARIQKSRGRDAEEYGYIADLVSAKKHHARLLLLLSINNKGHSDAEEISYIVC